MNAIMESKCNFSMLLLSIKLILKKLVKSMNSVHYMVLVLLCYLQSKQIHTPATFTCHSTHNCFVSQTYNWKLYNFSFLF